VRKRDILRAIKTAFDWHEGSWLYSFASCRKVVDEKHREKQIQCLNDSREYCDRTHKWRELGRLQHLQDVILKAPAGVELATYQEVGCYLH
jgi:hypothetical protein